MNAENIRTPTIIFPDRLARASLAGHDRNLHRFGGPLELALRGWPQQNPLPQRLVTLAPRDPVCNFNTRHLKSIPLVYGFCLDRCRLKYHVRNSREIDILQCEGKPETDWPYAGYPAMFPTVPLYFNKPEALDWRKGLEEDEDLNGLTYQDSRPERDEILVVVPSNDAYGVSLWGQSGDNNGVQVIFRINLESLAVEAWNECT